MRRSPAGPITHSRWPSGGANRHYAAVDAADLAAWGAVEVESRLAGGARNDVWAIRVDGRPLVARKSTRAAAALAWEVSLMAALRKQGVRTPQILPTLDGADFVGGITLSEMIQGDRPTTTPHWRAVYRYLATLHELTREWPQRPGFLSSRDLLSAERGGDVDLTEMPNEAKTRCRAAWSRVKPHETCVVHGDPGASNIFITREGDVVLIDWDEARVDAPAFDLAVLPDEVSPLSHNELWIARQAATAWEAAAGWRVEPEYARRQLAEVEALAG